MNKFPSIANTAARCFFIFLVVYLWLSYLVSGWILLIILSALITAFINTVTVILLRRKKNIRAQTKEQNEHMQKTILQLKFLKQQQILTLFKSALAEKGNCTLTSRKLTFKTEKHQAELFPLFHKEPTVSDVIDCLNAASRKGTVIIAAETFSPQILNFTSSVNIDIKLMNGSDVYREILTPSSTFPEFNIEIKTSSRRKLSQLKKIIFSPARTKGYVFTALIIFTTSFLVRFNIYYVIIATAVFTMAIISRFGTEENTNIFQ